MNITRTLTALLVLGAGAILLQIYLSKKESRWPGLVLPIIMLCISLLAVIGVATFTAIPATQQVVDENGVVIQETALEIVEPMQSTSSLLYTVGSVFLLYNIPTVVLLAIYFGCREKQRKRKALEKMQAQDLE